MSTSSSIRKYYIRFDNANLTEEEFIDCAKRDKNTAFSYLTVAYAQKIYGSCIQLVRNTEDAEDLVQEVFVSIYLSLDSFGGNSKLSTWIYAITHNKAKEFLRLRTCCKRHITGKTKTFPIHSVTI